MAIKTNIEFKQPADASITVWRFMDLPRFLDMLSGSHLYFCRADQFEDPLEGLPTDENAKTSLESIRANGADSVKLIEASFMMRTMGRFLALSRHCFFVNCWHLNEHEPAGMWRQYASGSYGVAVRSTYQRLKNALDVAKEEVNLGMVEYDQPANVLGMRREHLMMRKRANFRDEREVRALIVHSDQRTAPADKSPLGLRVRVDLDGLMEAILLAPNSPKWFRNTLDDVMSRYGHCTPVTHSALFRPYDGGPQMQVPPSW